MLSTTDFKTAVQLLPLVSIDLLVVNEHGQLLVGRRLNPPAKGSWFVPGGRIRKGELLDDAFLRITLAELGTACARSASRSHGLYDHVYPDDFTGSDTNGGTHYVVLPHRLHLRAVDLVLPDAQHNAYRWVDAEEAMADPELHANTRAYFPLAAPAA